MKKLFSKCGLWSMENIKACGCFVASSCYKKIMDITSLTGVCTPKHVMVALKGNTHLSKTFCLSKSVSWTCGMDSLCFNIYLLKIHTIDVKETRSKRCKEVLSWHNKFCFLAMQWCTLCLIYEISATHCLLNYTLCFSSS